MKLGLIVVSYEYVAARHCFKLSLSTDFEADTQYDTPST